MKPTEHSTIISQKAQGHRLDQFLFDWLNAEVRPISKGAVRKVLVGGGVYLNNRRVKIASKTVIPGAQVSIHVRWDDVQKTTQAELPLNYFDQAILFEDESIIAVNKPTGIPTQATVDQSRECLYEKLKVYLAQREGKSKSEFYLGLHHRLDRDTSGVIVFTKSQKANRPLAEQFQDRKIKKQYLAVVVGNPESPIGKRFSVKNFLRKSNASHRVEVVTSGGKAAETNFEMVSTFTKGANQVALLKCWPLTGRTHQIRIHLAEKKMPIFGDKTYGGKLSLGPHRAERMFLHANTISLSHPVKEQTLLIEAPVPMDFSQIFPDFKK